jgi:hypothetical protein
MRLLAPRPWWAAVTLGAVLAIFGACLVNGLAWIGQPFSGFLFLENGIVVSIGRAQWTHPRYRSVPFARAFAVDGKPIAGGPEIHAYLRATGFDKEVTYAFSKGGETFRVGLTPRRFAMGDFLELFLPLLGVGLLMVVVSAAFLARRPDAPELRALFAVSVSVGLTFITGPDEYAPYWFTSVFFLSLCAIPPAFLHLALTYPPRRAVTWRPPVVHAALYAPFLALGAALLWSMPKPNWFLPLLYTVYLFTANAVLLYVGSLVLGLIDGVRPREPVVVALAGVVGSLLVIVSILVAYPLLRLPISPVWLVSPVLLLPVLEGIAFLRFPRPMIPANGSPP